MGARLLARSAWAVRPSSSRFAVAGIGFPTLYRDEYVREVVEFCSKGYSITGFAGEIGVSRRSLTNWADAHPEFKDALELANAGRARWWEDQARKVAIGEGNNPQATMVIFGLKNHAAEDYKDSHALSLSGADGGPLVIRWEK